MKLFQQLLVAGTALGLISPFAAQASDTINLDGMSSYGRSEPKAKRFDNNTFVNEVNEEIVNLKGRVDGLEAQQNDFEAGSFSDTTTLDGTAVFTLGSLDTDDNRYYGETQAMYTYTMNLNTSFTGDDNLYTRIKTGNHATWSKTQNEKNTYLVAGKGSTDSELKIDKIWYEAAIGDNNTIWIGPKIENYYMHATTPSIYKPVLKAFTLGGNAAAYGASTSPGAGWAYNADNGFAISSNFTSKSGNSTGILNNQGGTSWATQVGYTQPDFSVSAIANIKSNDWTDSYYMSLAGRERTFGDGSSTNIGLRAWWRPEETGTAVPSISLGYDSSDTQRPDSSSTNAYFVGLNWQDIFTPDDRIGAAFGQPQKWEDDDVDPFLYEVYYDYKVNDSMTLTPAFFGGTSKHSGGGEVEMTGVVLNTTFKF